jgi:hypothetical protein
MSPDVNTEATMTSAEIETVLKSIPGLPDTAVVPVAVAAKHDSVSDRTVRRTYPLIQVSPGRKGVSVRYLRTREKPAA